MSHNCASRVQNTASFALRRDNGREQAVRPCRGTWLYTALRTSQRHASVCLRTSCTTDNECPPATARVRPGRWPAHCLGPAGSWAHSAEAFYPPQPCRFWVVQGCLQLVCGVSAAATVPARDAMKAVRCNTYNSAHSSSMVHFAAAVSIACYKLLSGAAPGCVIQVLDDSRYAWLRNA